VSGDRAGEHGPSGRPVSPSSLPRPAEATERLAAGHPALPDAVRARLGDAGLEVVEDPAALAEASRDWWPLTLAWAERNMVARRPSALVRPTSTEGVQAVLAAAHASGLGVTPVAGRSGVCGGTVPAPGGLLLDLTGLAGVTAVDETSLLVDVAAGTFGPDLEDHLAQVGPGYTVGHFPQSFDLSTVGGWLACRGAGQYSTRYGKIEDMTAGLVVVLADGTLVDTRHEAPRSATGPSLTQLFVGSEGALGVITEARLRLHVRPPARAVAAYAFSSFDQGLEACRLVLRRGATPAVLRLYDEAESERHFGTGRHCVLIVLDEADPGLLQATMEVVAEEASGLGASRLENGLVEQWLAHRNDVSPLVPLWQAGIVVDTAEVAGSWAVLPDLARSVTAALRQLEGTLAATVHQSHAYLDGACLYFTFAGRQDERASAPAGGDLTWMEAYYRQAWDTVTGLVADRGAAISHHHGIGLHRGRFMADALGSGLSVLGAVKAALDEKAILRPGAFGLAPASEKDGW
jgi:alkyldihydroxyacetonephosphate synthase